MLSRTPFALSRLQVNELHGGDPELGKVKTHLLLDLTYSEHLDLGLNEHYLWCLETQTLQPVSFFGFTLLRFRGMTFTDMV